MEQPYNAGVPWCMVRQHRRMLAQLNYYLTPDSKILDFGCGEGSLVYEYRDAGFQAYGFDIRPAACYRSPGDEAYFRFAHSGKPVNVPEYGMDDSWYRMPFDDNFFDFIVSTSTMEHVQDYDLALREMARVLKKGAIAIHTFPGRYRLVEPHMFIPFGGALRSYAWYWFWAACGVRNEHQLAMGTRECAENNLHYATTGLNYPRLNDVLAVCRKHYSEVDVVPRLWEKFDRGTASITGTLLSAPRIRIPATWLYSRLFDVMLFLRR
jgi:SAM-dependent methyltransferase